MNLNATTPIRTDRDEPIDEWIDALSTDRGTWGVKMDAVTRSTLRVISRSETEYTMTDLYRVFADPERRSAFTYAERTGEDPHNGDLDHLTVEDDALFNGLTRRVRRFVEKQRINRCLLL
jgi:hypothetical protein